MYSLATDKAVWLTLISSGIRGARRSACKCFGEHFPNGVYQADRTIVLEAFWRLCLVDEHHNCLIEVVEAAKVEVPERLEHPQNIGSNHLPRRPVECRRLH